MPGVRLVAVNAVLAREYVEGRESDIADPVHVPRVAAVDLAKRLDIRDLRATLRHDLRKLGLRSRIEHGELLRQGCPGGGPNRRVLLLNQLALPEGPRHHLAGQENPVRLERVAETTRPRGGAQALYHGSVKRRVAEAWPARSRGREPAGCGL